MLNQRTLFLHAGFHKTGSSALQNYLHKNKEQLERSGIAYRHSPEHPLDHAGSGNGERLHRLFKASSDSEIKDIIESYFGEHGKALCSNEDFFYWSPSEWKKLERICYKIDVIVSPIIFVRNPISYFISQYKQWIKGGSEHCSLREWLDIKHPYADVLRVISGIFPPSAIHVIHYETEKNRLDSAFLEKLGLDIVGFDRSALEKVVNRTLTEFELSLARQANAICAEIGFSSVQGLLAYSLSEAWLARYPDLKPGNFVSGEIRTLIETHYRIDVDWINQVFFDGAEIVSFAGLQEDKTQDMSDAQKQDILETSFLWAVSKIADFIKYRSEEIIVQHVRAALQKAQACQHPEHGIPDDFDPFYYLVQYPDLVRSGEDPYRHFISSGLQEGRSYSWRRDYH